MEGNNMNITEDQNIGNEHKAEDAGNTQSPTISTSAKKVYSKPTLVLPSPIQGTNGKRRILSVETTSFITPFPAGLS